MTIKQQGPQGVIEARGGRFGDVETNIGTEA